jgi:hypothetical protein
MILDAVTKKLQVILDGAKATNDCPFVAAWTDITTTAFTPGSTDGTTNGASAVDMVGVPGASTQRQVKTISVFNADTAAVVLSVLYNNNGTTRVIIKLTLQVGDTLLWDSGGWRVLDSSGNFKDSTAVAASDTASGVIELAIQSEMEAGTDVTRAVTPGRQHFHPSAAKGWGKAAGSGSLTTGYNMDAVTDTTTGTMGVNITTNISSANYAIVSGTAAVATTLTVATIDNGAIVYNNSQAVGAFSLWNFDHTATTHVVQDPQSYFWAIFGDFA